jgi:hypothetical protein
MATKRQKQELLEALRAEKKKYEIVLTGYGGEIAIGRITQEQYEFWKEREDLDEHCHDWDNEMEIPDNVIIARDGSWYECDDIAHENGCEFSDACWVTVYDEDKNEVWTSPLSSSALEERGVGVEGMNRDEHYVEYDTDAEYYFWGQHFEKGTFQTYEIEIYGKFDPARLNFSTIDVNGWELVNGVSYESIELDDTGGYSTTGKATDYGVERIER